jgi:L-ascorbate metabolism protein UlaG (beta-lactamase superfamily)
LIAVEACDWDEQVKIGDAMAVTPVPTRHWSARNLSDRNMSLWASFVIEVPQGLRKPPALPPSSAC